MLHPEFRCVQGLIGTVLLDILRKSSPEMIMNRLISLLPFSPRCLCVEPLSMRCIVISDSSVDRQQHTE